MSLPLSDDELDREFDLGLRTLRATLAHVVRNVEVWTAVMTGAVVPAKVARPSVAGMIEVFDAWYSEFEVLARAVRDGGRDDELWTDPLDNPPTEKSFGGAIAHVITHSMHHRCQALFMLRRLGVEGVPEGDALSCEGGTIA